MAADTKRTPRRIRQSGNALRKLIRSIATEGVSSKKANGEELFPRTKPRLAVASQCYGDRLLMALFYRPGRLSMSTAFS